MCPANTLSVTCSLQLAKTKKKTGRPFWKPFFLLFCRQGLVSWWWDRDAKEKRLQPVTMVLELPICPIGKY
jgi:hypothetical protein